MDMCEEAHIEVLVSNYFLEFQEISLSQAGQTCVNHYWLSNVQQIDRKPGRTNHIEIISDLAALVNEHNDSFYNLLSLSFLIIHESPLLPREAGGSLEENVRCGCKKYIFEGSAKF
jgi:hypothetical protein